MREFLMLEKLCYSFSRGGMANEPDASELRDCVSVPVDVHGSGSLIQRSATAHVL